MKECMLFVIGIIESCKILHVCVAARPWVATLSIPQISSYFNAFNSGLPKEKSISTPVAVTIHVDWIVAKITFNQIMYFKT